MMDYDYVNFNQKQLTTPVESIPDVISVIPIVHRPLFPGMLIPIIITGENMIITAKKIVESENNIGGTTLIKEQFNDQIIIKSQNLYKIGSLVKILKVNPINEKSLQLIVNVLYRFSQAEVTQDEPIIKWRINIHEEKKESSDNMRIYSMAIVAAVKDLIKSNSLYKDELKLFINRFSTEDPGRLSDFVASLTSADAHNVQEILETFDIRKRVDKVLILLKKELKLNNLQIKITKQIENKISKNQKDFLLREQLKEIKKELGIIKEENVTEIDKFQERIKSLVLTEEAEKKIDEEINKLSLLDPHSPEYTVSRNYLDWLTSLPWGKYSKDNFEIPKAKKILDRDHYGLDDIKDRILEFISIGKVKGKISGSIICFIGPPGVGKTSIGKSVAEALNRKFFRFSLGGMRDEAEIKGHRRTYIGSMPGKIIQILKLVGTSNPVIMLDEIDKIGVGFQGDPASALLEVLDSEQNNQFLDHYIDTKFDLSNVLFILTGNHPGTIPPALINRMEIMNLSGYILEEKFHIARRYLISKQMKEHGITKKMIKFDNKSIRKIIDGYSREAGVRSLENNIRKILRKAARSFAEGQKEQIIITPDNLKNFLGNVKFSDETFLNTNIPGVVMGLAWTNQGGTILNIEATAIPTKESGFKQTGQLGDVMKESTEIAYTYISSSIKNQESSENFFEKHFIHLHVPSGATPKDGPSAGITMAAALYSLVKNKAINKGIAMTGELTITGKVLPIGGLKEKIIAAKRAKIKTIILPLENKHDFEELPENIKKNIKVKLVNYFDEILKIVY